MGGTEVWQLYGMDGELLAEYPAGNAPFAATKEYGYRAGELLVTASSGDDGRARRFVQNLYYGALHRDPTAAELQQQTDTLAQAGVQGQSQLQTAAAQMARSLFTSTSYETSPYRTDTQYVSDLYNTYLQRGADTGGLSYWAGAAASSRANVCDGFEASAEFQAVVSTLYGTSASDNQRTEQYVTNFYLGAYGRGATSTELQQQRDALNAAAAQGQSQVQAQAEAMGRTLFAGQVTDMTLTNTQYVTNLYAGFLQRGGDDGGLNFWVGQAASSRQNVLDAFATSGAARALSATLYREVNWLVSDHLSTPRMIVGKSGLLGGVKRHDYLPFGEEVGAGVSGRTTVQGYVGYADGVRQKFGIGYERDNETGPDYAKARYYSSIIGRFASVDPLAASAKPGLPQSWNRYSYCLNNPLLYIDPTGMIWGYKKNGKITTYEWFDGNKVGEGFEVLKDFYVEGIVDGREVGVTFNPNGPYSTAKLLLMASTAAKFVYSDDPYYVKGFKIGPTREQHAAYMRTGAVENDYAFQFAATGLFTSGLSWSSRSLSNGAGLAATESEGASFGEYLAGKAPKQVQPGVVNLMDSTLMI